MTSSCCFQVDRRRSSMDRCSHIVVINNSSETIKLFRANMLSRAGASRGSIGCKRSYVDPILPMHNQAFQSNRHFHADVCKLSTFIEYIIIENELLNFYTSIDISKFRRVKVIGIETEKVSGYQYSTFANTVRNKCLPTRSDKMYAWLVTISATSSHNFIFDAITIFPLPGTTLGQKFLCKSM
uniref:Uncharacterized protein n=1 Tax=Romanomermis culicivorax TaxID=13658 RepID=A0A915JNB3_ROMCU